MIRVLIADDEELVRTGLRMILQSEPDLEVVGEAGDGQDALSQSASLEPDVLLLDLHMPELDGLGVLRGLAGVGPSVVVLTTFDTDENVLRALRLGASGEGGTGDGDHEDDQQGGAAPGRDSHRRESIRDVEADTRGYPCRPAAPWRSGYAAACKAVYAGSIPAGAFGRQMDKLR